MTSSGSIGGPSDSSQPSANQIDWIAPLLVLAALVAAYAHTLTFQFVFDDPILIVGNPFIQSAANIPRFFTEHFWSGVALAQKSYYRPLSLIYLLANWKLWGADPLGWHAVSVLLHSVNTVFVYLLALRFLKPRASAPLGAGFAAVLFALHPIQAEVVSWICCFNDLLATLFVLISFHAWCNARGIALWPQPARREHSALWFCISVAAYAVAVMCKEPAALFPLVLVVAEISQPGEPEAAPRGPSRVLRLLPYFGVAAIYFAMRTHALGTATTPQSRIIYWRTEWLTLPSVLGGYLSHLLLPVGLSPFYDTPYHPTISLSGVVLPSLILIALASLLLWAALRSPHVRILTAWTVIFLAPTLHLGVLPRGELLHDRYFYLPMAGLSVIAGIGIAAAADKWGPEPEARLTLGIGIAILAAAFSFASYRQSRFWEDNLALYSRGVAIAPHNGLAASNLGAVLLGRGQWNEAVVQFQNAINDSPNMFLAQYDLGLAYYEVGRFPEAEASFKRALALVPSDAETNIFLGMTYYHTNRLPQAIEQVRKAIALNSAGAGYHFALAVMLKDAGDVAGARAEFQAELKRDPNHQPSIEQLRQLDQPGAPPTGAKP